MRNDRSDAAGMPILRVNPEGQRCIKCVQVCDRRGSGEPIVEASWGEPGLPIESSYPRAVSWQGIVLHHTNTRFRSERR